MISLRLLGSCLLLCLQAKVVDGLPVLPVDYNGTYGDYPNIPEYDDYNNMYMPGDMFVPGSPFCVQKETCDSTAFSWPSKSCYCDDICAVFTDCCSNIVPSYAINAPSIDLFQCTVIPEIGQSFGVLYVNKCPPQWPDEEVKTLCENDQHGDDVFLRLPVSENGTEIVFKNMYCSFCNERYDYRFWKPELKCATSNNDSFSHNISSVTNCDMIFLPPSRDTSFKYRKCPLVEFIHSCPSEVTDQEAIERCENGQTSHVFADRQWFKNSACAECFGIPRDLIVCEPTDLEGGISAVPDIGKRKWYSFRALVDFNSGGGEFGEIRKETEFDYSEMCSDDEIYDPFTEKCRRIFCVPPRWAVKGKCVIVEINMTVSRSHSPAFADPGVSLNILPNCTLLKLNQSEYNLKNDSQIYVYSSNKLYESSDYFHVNGSIFICHSGFPECGPGCSTNTMFYSDVIESYVTLITLIISLTALAFNFIVYICFSQLRNTPGKILMCLIISLFFAQLFFLISPQFEEFGTVCMCSAIVVHFFYMSAFCWMNAIALDLWMTFSNQFLTAGSNEKSKKFLYFSLYAWLIPALIVIFSIVIDNIESESGLQNFKPGYGDGACWITSQNGVLLFFAGPLILFKCFDIIAFINTARHIYKAKKHGAVARQNNDSCTFWINLKLSLVMGLTWVFAFVANFANERIIWYLFIIFNALQGVFIAVSFIFTKKAIRLLSERAQTISSFASRTTRAEISMSGKNKMASSSSGTKLTVVSQSDERV